MGEIAAIFGEASKVHDATTRVDGMRCWQFQPVGSGEAVAFWCDDTRSPMPAGVECFKSHWIAWRGVITNRGELNHKHACGVATTPGRVIEFLWTRLSATEACRAISGPLAAIIWDHERRRLFAYRDKMGLVPMVWARSGDGLLVISTRPRFVADVALEVLRPDLEHLRDFMLVQIDAMHTEKDALRGIHRLFPAELNIWEGQRKSRSSRYWTVPSSYLPSLDLASHARVFRHHLEVAIAGFHESLGTHVTTMSGGVDSTAITALYARQLGSSNSEPVACFSEVAPKFPRLDESVTISHLERSLPIRVHRFDVADLWALKPGVLVGEPDLASGPPSFPSQYWNIQFLKWASEVAGNTRFFEGEGSDILQFASRYQVFRRLMEKGDSRALISEWRHAGMRQGVHAIARIFTDMCGVTEHARSMLQQLRALGASFKVRNASPWTRPATWVIPQPADNHMRANRDELLLPQRKERWLASWGWEQSARLFDELARRARVQISNPFFDDRLWEWGARLPPEMLLRQGFDKFIQRTALRGVLSEQVLFRRDTSYFDNLLMEGLGIQEVSVVESLFSDSCWLADAGLIEPALFLNAYEGYKEFVRDRGASGELTSSRAIWRTVAAEMWLRALDNVVSPSLRTRL